MGSSTATSVSSPRSSELDHDSPVAVRCRGVTKRFYYYEQRTTTLREVFIRSLTRRPLSVKVPLFTLTGFDLTIHRGESVALIGANGSGKSTVLRLIAGIYGPTDGVIDINGRVAAVIELGAGFHPELTGAENVEFYGSVVGLTRRERQARYQEIVEFAGVRPFMDVPMKYYSSGMRARLAFAVSICLDPDILLIDEVLAVGDAEFRQRCLDRLHRFRNDGRTLLLVSHSLEMVTSLCSRAVWLDKGVVRTQGPVHDVVDAYVASAT